MCSNVTRSCNTSVGVGFVETVSHVSNQTAVWFLSLETDFLFLSVDRSGLTLNEQRERS